MNGRASWACRVLGLAMVVASLACSGPVRQADPEPRPEVLAEAPLASLELIESWPSESSLDDPLLRDAAQVWVEVFGAAKTSIELSEFYATTAPGSALEPVITALLDAAERGVKVRMIVDTKLLKGNTEVPERLEAHPNIEVRRFDLGAVMGGVQHSKYFVVDGELAFLGSQNFDYRALEHVLELGVLIRVPELVEVLHATFEYDWALAGGTSPEPVSGAWAKACDIGLEYASEPVKVCAALSPKGFLVDEQLWDLPKMLALIDTAKSSIAIQLLDYSAINYDKSRFDELEVALRRAAERGVHLRLMVSDWSKRPKTLPQMLELQALPNVDVRFVTIPEHSSGFIPHARTIHAKTMVVDGTWTWLGTSNWSGDYFYKSRNVGIIVEGASFARDVQRFFETTWSSKYAYDVDPEADNTPPRIKE